MGNARIQRQELKNSYEMGGLKASDMTTLNSALKVKQFINATKSKNKINILQRLCTTRSAPISMTQRYMTVNYVTMISSGKH